MQLQKPPPIERLHLLYTFGAKIFYLIIILLMLEITLRVQQKWGPLYDLEFSKYNLDEISYDLDHKPSGAPYNEDGVQRNLFRPASFPAEAEAVSILFMGDSFMQGYPDKYTIPQYMWEYFKKQGKENLLLLNAGFSSYSPSIYIVQAKKLIPKLQPDFVVIDIDETDMVDDYANYRSRSVRDQEGKIIAVQPSPIFLKTTKTMIEIRQHPIYLMRFILSIWYQRIYFKYQLNVYKKTFKGKYYAHPLTDINSRYSYNLAATFDEDANTPKYDEEKKYFRSTVEELIETLISLLGSPDKILIVRHPHLHQLIPDDRGILWPSPVAKIVREAALKFDVRYFDSTEILRERFGNWIRDYYFEDNMHLTYDGLRGYAEAISEELTPMLN